MAAGGTPEIVDTGSPPSSDDVGTGGTMGDPLFWHRLQFGFTATYHYLFPPS